MKTMNNAIDQFVKEQQRYEDKVLYEMSSLKMKNKSQKQLIKALKNENDTLKKNRDSLKQENKSLWKVVNKILKNTCNFKHNF